MMHVTIIGRVAAAAGLMLFALPSVGEGQSARDSVLYLKAQHMAANGDAAGGRRLVDSVAAGAPAGSAAYAEGLFWKATLAANARDSEHAYREIIVDYPLSGRVPDALLRIGQLESSRGENAAAQQHFQRLVLEHPKSPLRAEGSYWLARMYFDSNDMQRGCTANADAVSSVRASNVELKNRIDFQQQRCRGVTLATNAPVPATPVPATPVPVPSREQSAASAASAAAKKTVSKPTTPVQESDVTKAPATVVPAPTSVPVTEPVVTTPVTVPVDKAPVTRRPPGAPVPPTPPPPRKPPVMSSSGRGPVTRPPTKEEVDRALASAPQARQLKLQPDTEKSSEPVRKVAAKTPATAPRPVAPATPSTGGSYAVQVAAFADKTPAAALVTKLRGRGYNAYVDGTKAPYRVRIGHYPTHAAAAAALVKLKAKQINGFVAQR